MERRFSSRLLWDPGEGSGPPGIRTSGNPEIRESGHPGIRTSGNPGFLDSGHPEIRNSGHPGIRESRIPGFRESGNPDIREFGIPDIRGSGNPDIRESGMPEIRESGDPRNRASRTQANIFAIDIFLISFTGAKKKLVEIGQEGYSQGIATSRAIISVPITDIKKQIEEVLNAFVDILTYIDESENEPHP
ncbi:Protein CBG21125 [Caenorhabditis briggsae]|uniref:Protein CBG21125 n=1 Tax=Caenorhabditis briggsae TaxID=6238 RepID=A8XZF5_CAEBR|nr:Protein CBG21125 [Caenorhabditis briggsae]CAP38082.1 Protein CBG21125 [Caenorhabditis briggsae]